MTNKISHDFPAPGEPLAPSHANTETLALLTRRRSTPAIGLTEPGPDASQVEHLLGIASRVPDHGKLAPWRFILFEGEARTSFGMILGKVWAVKNPDATPDQTRCEQQRFERAPLVIAVISTVTEHHKIPLWEQELSAGAACQNLLIAASAMGFGAQWLTEWYAYDCDVKDALGLRSGERIAGYIYIGTSAGEVMERPRPRAHVGRWKA
ncbi:nitroreductase [uncultured Maricaulis sp.]|uniref:nitroreductase family protein n=1 Tax=uncultured Maricaulis sp. TaxID=174710 RepID=UPI0030DADEAE|tara:strand:- start:1594 stop:2220 length:627 start_codon:yes stop_codon:yes gene_type:complete